MARMHSRKKGKSASAHPPAHVNPDWVTLDKKEAEKLIIDLFKAGNSMSRIGLILRDQYGVPSVKALLGKSVKELLDEHKLLPAFPEDLMNLIRKAVSLHNHMKTNRMDNHNKRIMQLTESKIRRLVHYYKEKKMLPEDWHYEPDSAALLVKE